MARGASLDRLEGELIEGAGLIVLVIIAVVIFGLYKSAGNLSNLPAAIAQALSALINAILNFFQKLVPNSSSQPFSGPLATGNDWVMTGTNIGLGGTTMDLYDPSLSDFQFAPGDVQLLQLPETPIDPFAGLPSVQLPSMTPDS